MCQYKSTGLFSVCPYYHVEQVLLCSCQKGLLPFVLPTSRIIILCKNSIIKKKIKKNPEKIPMPF